LLPFERVGERFLELGNHENLLENRQPFCALNSLISRTEVKAQLIELVELAKKGDKPSFDEVIRLCVPDLFRIAMAILKNKDDAGTAYY